MGSAAGKHWAEEEVKALLSVWAEKNIRQQLHGTLRNKGIFIYIAKRLQSLGVCRDWKQCRAKYKNLKYKYRIVKYAHKCGDSSKTMKFFQALNAILQRDPDAQLTEKDVNSSYLATLSWSTAPQTTAGISTPIMEPSNNSIVIPTVANEGGKHWTEAEVRALIGIWSDKSIQRQLEGTARNKRIFEQIAAKLQKLGVERDWKQCRTKYKSLTHEYKTVRTAQDLDMTKSMKYFPELDALLGHNKTENSREQGFQDGDQAKEGVDVKMQEDHTEDPEKADLTAKFSENPRIINIEEESLDTAEEDTMTTTSEEVGSPTTPRSITGSENYLKVIPSKEL